MFLNSEEFEEMLWGGLALFASFYLLPGYWYYCITYMPFTEYFPAFKIFFIAFFPIYTERRIKAYQGRQNFQKLHEIENISGRGVVVGALRSANGYCNVF